ncbi:MAG: hypothetical protein ACE5JS_04040 [Nitrospinota bacterium]
MNRLFDLEEYQSFLSAFLEAGYEIVDFEGARDRWKQGRRRFAVWRHDVDFCLKRAADVARAEARAGVRADYFVMVKTLMYNLLDPRETSRLEEIRELGHRIGLHFDAGLHEDGGKKSLEVQIERECKILQECINRPVSMITFHRPTESLLDKEIYPGGRGHGYESVFFKEMAYFSDSRGYWRYGCPLKSAAFAKGHPMQVLTHPIWWTGPAGQGPTERLEDFAAGRLNELRQEMARNCQTYQDPNKRDLAGG